MTTRFAHLHVHDDHSLLDGLAKIDDYFVEASRLGFTHLAQTNHGNVSGAFEFYTKAVKAGIRPNLGCEFYFVPDATAAREEKDPERFHIGIIARNEDGFKTICELNTEAHRRFYYKPLLDRALIESLGNAAENLVCLSGCAGSILSRAVLEGGLEAANDELAWWRQQSWQFYIELQHHGSSTDRKLNRRLIKLAKTQGLEWVITNDSHYVRADEEDNHDALLAIQTGSDIDDPNRFRFDGSGYHLRSRAEMRRAFAEYGDSIWLPGVRTTNRVGRDCALTIPAWDRKSWHLPRYPKTRNAKRELRRLCFRGLRERGLDGESRYVDRAESELKDLNEAGLADFMLITRDFLNFAKENGIPFGPGRGSVCGTLVGYAIGIHKIDPIRYRLRFDRFLNIARPKMPDIDSDFAPDRRAELPAYAIELYGEENVVRVAAFQTMKVRSAFQALARSHGIEGAERNRLTKLLGIEWNQEEEEGLEEEEAAALILPEEMRESYPDLAMQMRALIGTKRAVSRHPAGVVIFAPDDPIKDINPQQWLVNKSVPGGGYFASQYTLKAIEGMGLLKQDFLGLRTLSTIDECVRMVERNHGVKLDPDSWVPDSEKHDAAVYKMLASGDVDGVFQMEGHANRTGIQEMRCSCFEDIVACTSAYRAGPMSVGTPARFVKNKRDGVVRVIHPDLEPILGDSWGEMIYQEQMMDIAEHIAGFDMGLVADLLAAVRFKDPAMMEPLKEKFIAGSLEHGLNEHEAQKVWEMIEAQAVYLFNRSHAVAYSFTTYQTARLKYLYPLEFYTALLRTVDPKNDDNKARRERYVSCAVENNFDILPPDINLSDIKATCDPETNSIRFGFADCKHIGVSLGAKILEQRSEGFADYDDAEECLGKVALDVLGPVGGFASIGGPPAEPKAQREILGWDFEDRMADVRAKYQSRIRLPRTDNGSCRIYGEIVATDSRKTKNGKKFVVWTVQFSPSRKFKVTIWSDADELWDVHKGSVVRVQGRWSKTYDNIGVSDAEQVRVLRRPA